MSMLLLDGRRVAEEIRGALSTRVAALRRAGVVPTLGVLRAGAHPASATFIRRKRDQADEIGVRVHLAHLPETAAEADARTLLDAWNADDRVHGIIVQLPLPPGLPQQNLTRAVAPEKDVDGLHPENIGLLAHGRPRFLPPTPAGIVELLTRHGIAIAGARVVIVGRSALVGTPLALALLRKTERGNATVTVCHTGTRDLPAMTRQADILIVAAGKPRLVTAEHVRGGSVVVDVGMNRTADGWVGDVDQDAVSERVAAMSPVPGGVGPMTVIMLLANVVRAAERASGFPEAAEGPGLSLAEPYREETPITHGRRR